ncbi:hypothetical protein HYPSUDRAFT_126774 [Hypholoma sublateritium FD-334 SS-4]|uniref:Uncharacterized protein n=1 Tax=Hypholoma sublateritium (strain FD-334 SS-4) TaxID=945553 RepID=A0A0D2PQ17_HYPSF|nr:hypothetical protein HYPSUDRAFT_126774 [Hypholoma sublateritium FD-334 SS-4]
MEYTPRFPQPFTLSEAINLDVAVITEEISRLRNSLARLRATQIILQAELEVPGEIDSEITKAFDENKIVIGSQEERISILKMALTEKGITSGSHYDTTTASLAAPSPIARGTLPTSQFVSANATQDYTDQSNESEDAGGVFL